MRTAVFTIASRNYFAFVRTLMGSLEQSNPDWERYVVVADEISEEFQSIIRNFSLLSLQELDLPEKEKMLFRYTIMELNTAVKPFAFETLFEKKGFDKVVYLDPDIFVYEKMREVEEALDNGLHFVLTPHLTGRLEEDGKMPDEPAIMRAGIYNLGFIALRRADTTLEMLRWWQKKLEKQCIVAVEEGIFVDQKWMDLIPGRYSDVFILRHEGYNVAYWNLPHRNASVRNNKFYFNGQRLVFFHFSGLDPKNLFLLSKHSDRYRTRELGILMELVKQYADRVLKNDFNSWKRFSYSFDIFYDGRPVNELFRYIYRNREDIQKTCGNDPFACSSVFYETYRQEVVTSLKEYLWRSRRDLQKAYPEGYCSKEYISWLQNSCEKEYNLPPGYLQGINLCEKVYKDWKSSFKVRMHKVLPKRIWNLCRWVNGKYNGIRYKRGKARKADKKNLIVEGVNLIGYIKSEHGIGEACRLTAECLQTAGLDWSAYDFEYNNPSRQKDTSWDYKIDDQIKYDISILNINADQMDNARKYLPEEVWNGYKIGIWYWELMDFPDIWSSAFELVDEIWAPTKFIQEALQKKATCPVIHMPPGIKRAQPNLLYNRKYFGLPEEGFLFLNMYDSFSYSNRKNPEAAINAFKQAFDKDDHSVGFVLKLNNPGSKSIEEAKSFLGEYKNIYILQDILTREEVNALIVVCNAAISLHRSEGLGLLCEEAMYYGKPVIATNWSGNIDFMTKDTACLVDYELTDIGQDNGPYGARQKWAEADVGQASEYMTLLKNDSAYYEKISKNAQKYIRQKFSPEICGARMRERICEIRREKCKGGNWDEKRRNDS